MRYAVVAVIVVSLLVGGGTYLWNNATGSSQEAFTVNANGKVLVSPQEWATAQAGAAKVEKFTPGYKASLDNMVDEKLEYAEAEKRGLACTTEEAAAQVKINTQSVVEFNPDIILHNAEISGIAPEGYSLTPEAQRTPVESSPPDR